MKREPRSRSPCSRSFGRRRGSASSARCSSWAAAAALVWWLVRARLRRALERERLALELHESQERMKLATEAAGIGVWEWNTANNQVWGSEKWLRLVGFASGDTIDFDTSETRPV